MSTLNPFLIRETELVQRILVREIDGEMREVVEEVSSHTKLILDEEAEAVIQLREAVKRVEDRNFKNWNRLLIAIMGFTFLLMGAGFLIGGWYESDEIGVLVVLLGFWASHRSTHLKITRKEAEAVKTILDSSPGLLLALEETGDSCLHVVMWADGCALPEASILTGDDGWSPV